jgi:hypothetical protein
MTRYFFQCVSAVVEAKVTVNRSDWASVEIPAALTEVDESTYASVVEGSTANPDGTYTPPVMPARSKRLGKFTFLRLLTPTEYAGMFSQSDPTLAYGVACFEAAPDPFNIDDPLVGQMLNYCVSSGVLTQARKDELWAAMQAAAI